MHFGVVARWRRRRRQERGELQVIFDSLDDKSTNIKQFRMQLTNAYIHGEVVPDCATYLLNSKLSY